MRPLSRLILSITFVSTFVSVAQSQSWQPPIDAHRCPSKWGATDERGAANHMRPGSVLRATRLIKTGEVIPVDQLPLARALRGEQDILMDIEVEIHGKRTLVREWATCIRSPDGNVRFGLAFFEDLTEELRRKSELQNLVTLLEATLESREDRFTHQERLLSVTCIAVS